MHIKKMLVAVFILVVAVGTSMAQPGALSPLSPEAPVQQTPDLGKQIKEFLKREGTGENFAKITPDNLISVNFKDVPLADAITVLSKQASMNITLDKDIDNKLTVTSVYSGTSVENALRSITSGADLSYKRAPGGYLVVPWTESYIDINKLYQFGGAGGSPNQSSSFGAVNPYQQANMGGAGGSTGSNMANIIGTQAGQYGTSNVSLSDFGGYMDSLLNMIKPMLSKQGIVTYMPSGFIYVRDHPSRVRAVEEMFDMDNRKREEVGIKITILRIDYKKEYESGIDWNKVFAGFKVGNAVTGGLGGSFLGDLTDVKNNVLTFNYHNLNGLDLTAKLLSKYGNVKIVHSWESRAMTGSVIPFDLTQLVWYSAGSVIQVINNQTITTPQVQNTPVGLSIILNPTKTGDKYLVNTSIKMSSVVSQQTIGDLTFPNIENNAVSVPIKLLPGEQVAISGFKINSATKNTIGIPILSQLPILEYLFGYKTAQNETSEIAVVISLDREKTGKAI